MPSYESKKFRFTEYEDIMGLLASNHVYALINEELLDIRHFMC
mgnify:CR=1 FL=1